MATMFALVCRGGMGLPRVFAAARGLRDDASIVPYKGLL